MKNLLVSVRFGMLYGITFLFVEGLLSAYTHWGEYAPDTFLIWKTPVYLLPVWCIIATGWAYSDQVVEEFLARRIWVRMAVSFTLMFVCALIGESLGVVVRLWTFAERHFTLWSVPIWVPIAYALAFSISPLIHRRTTGGLIQALLVGICWQISLFSWW